MRAQGERTLDIGPDRISDPGPCYVIAEIGHNHQGSVDKCKELFDRAKECGASAAKLQKRDNRTLFTDEYFHRPYENPNSFGATYGEHREALEFGRDEYLDLKAHAQDIGITFFATPFDMPSVDFLADLDMPAYKVASADVTNTPLLAYIAEVGKPVILSTGAATLEDVVRAYETLTAVNPEVAILQCTSGYPADWEELDLRVIETYRDVFPDSVAGFSGHDNGIAMAVAAYVIGGRIVEKHFTLDRAMRGTDHRFSLEPQGLQKMVRDLERVRTALGAGTKTVYASEAAPATKMGKKLVAARDLPAGHVLEAQDVAAKSPGDGIPPYELPKLVGGSLRRSIVKDQDLGFELLDPRPNGGARPFSSAANAV
ncbi:MAG: N-acetylneuraminate synthase family protein [Thermoleophilaceae bacterium]|nr:N-acetylneuraminate synthase family protein [Thermoleophilaceae bacterium]